MEARVNYSTNNRYNKYGNRNSEPAPTRHELWLRKIQEVAELNREYLKRIHQACEVARVA